MLGFPVLLFIAILPLALVFAALLRSEPLAQIGSPSIPLITTALALAAAAIAGHLLFALLYLGSPTFTDHIEPNAAIVSWIYAQGGQIYHSVDSAERYSFLYGPVPYIATSWMYVLLGGGTFAAKLAGFISLLVTFLFIVLAVRQWFSGRIIPCLVALGYFSLAALLFKNNSFWSKPDSFLLACTAIGLYSCLTRVGRNSWMLCGLALGIAVNAKITGAVYFLPYLAWFFDRDGFRSVLVISLAAAVTALLPFWSVEQISLTNYLFWLRSAGGHGISPVLLLQNFVFLLFIALPLGLYLAWQQGSVGIRSWLATHALVSFAAIAASALILIAASKTGSGPNHFLPFLPALAFLTAVATARVYAYRPATNWSVYGFWAPATAFLLALVIKAGLGLYFGLKVVLSQASDVAIAEDIAAIVADNPGRNVYMGYGDGSRYPATFLRTELAYAGQPFLIDAAALMDFQASGVAIPQATIDSMLGDESAIWLIPAGQEPFRLVNWYYRYTDGLLFDDAFRSAFSMNFYKLGSTDYFDLYAQDSGGSSGP
jgi:hypothetical protein